MNTFERLRKRFGFSNALGEGVWRRAFERCRRAVDRFHQVIEPIPAGDERNRLELVGTSLAHSLDRVEQLCIQAQRAAPSQALEVPGGPEGRHPELHRAISRVGNSTAQAAEAAALARHALLSGDAATARDRVTAAERHAARVRDSVQAIEPEQPPDQAD